MCIKMPAKPINYINDSESNGTIVSTKSQHLMLSTGKRKGKNRLFLCF